MQPFRKNVDVHSDYFSKPFFHVAFHLKYTRNLVIEVLIGANGIDIVHSQGRP